MNAHMMIHIVEGPLLGDAHAANEPVFDPPPPRAREVRLTLLAEPAESNHAPDSNVDNAARAKTTEQNDYVLGGYAGI
jgi:hypothetical protein